MQISSSAAAPGDFRLFKYRSVNKRLLDSLVKSYLWFARPDKLNDPFDCQLDLRKSFERAVTIVTGSRQRWLQGAIDNPGFFEMVSGVLRQVGVLSFSPDCHNHQDTSVMWSHYGDEHRGVCLQYRFPESCLTDPNNDILGKYDVTYEDSALTNWLINDAPMELIEFSRSLAMKYLSVKSPAWKYEREIRVIRNKPGMMNIPLGFLEQVCFGLRTPQPDIELVVKLAREHCGCKKFCQVIRDDKTDFGLEVVRM